MKKDLEQLNKKPNNDITLVVNMDSDIHFVKEIKTPAQIWYYCTVYPEEVTIACAEEMYTKRKKSDQSDGYFESVFRLVYGKKWEGSKLEKQVNKTMEEYYSEQKERNKKTG